MPDDPTVPEYAIEWGFGKKLAPRLGFAWDVQGDGKTKVYGSWACSTTSSSCSCPWAPSVATSGWSTTTRWTAPTSARSSTTRTARRLPGTLQRGPIDFRHVSLGGYVDADLKPMQMQEFVVGAERELASNLSVSARWVHKWIVRAVEDAAAWTRIRTRSPSRTRARARPRSRTSFTDGSGTVALPKPKRDYDGVELALNKRLSNNWSGRVSYLWSRLYGNYSGLSQTDENSSQSPNVRPAVRLPAHDVGQDGQPVFGALATDRPHQFKAQFLYDFNFGLSAGLQLVRRLGYPEVARDGLPAAEQLPGQLPGAGQRRPHAVLQPGRTSMPSTA